MERRENNNLSKIKEILKKKKLLFAFWECKDEYRSIWPWTAPLKKIFGEVIVFDPQKNGLYYGPDGMRKRFLEIIKKEKPDYIFLYLISNEFNIETIEKIKEISPNSRIINFFGDDDVRFETFSRYIALFLDYVFTQPKSKLRYKKEGIKRVYSFNGGINIHHYTPLNLKKKYDLVFVGIPKVNRVDIIKFLIKNGIKINLWGYEWKKYPEFKYIQASSLDSRNLVKITNQAKINLSLTKNPYGLPHMTGKVLEIAACKSFQLVEYNPEYLEYFKENKEIVMFKDKEDLLKKIRYYLKHEEEREKIAEAMYKITVEKYNQEIEMTEFFGKLINDEKNFSREKLPELNKKIVQISEIDFRKGVEYLKDKIKNADYICFSRGRYHRLKYKNYLQAYSLEKSGRDISCCEYYVNSKDLGNYLLFRVREAFEKLDKKEFSNLINLNQLMVSKNYFYKKINNFRNFFHGKKINLLNNENTIFIEIPLLQIYDFNPPKYDILCKVFLMDFRIRLYSLFHQKKLLFSKYPYKLLFESFFRRKFFILKFLLDSLFDKTIYSKLKKQK